jgi:hypothetical protein
MSTYGGGGDGLAAAFPGPRDGIPARTGVRPPGGQPGNRNRWVHGRRSAAAIERRKTGAAGRKAAAWVLVQLDALPGYRCRPRTMRADQVALLAVVDPAGLRIAEALGMMLGPAA